MNVFTCILVVLGMNLAACSKVNFSTRRPISLVTPKDFPEDPDPDEVFGDPNGKAGIFDFYSSFNKGQIWVVTNVYGANKVYLITLDAAKTYPMKTWTISPGFGNGNRTYVTSIGLLIGKIWGRVFRVSEDMADDSSPTPTSFQPVWSATGANDGTRACLSSFKVGNTSYVGFAWENSNSERMFTRIPIDTTKPNGLDLASKSEVNLGGSKVNDNSLWSYGCFTDQSRKYFWGGWYPGGTGASFFGINLDNLTALNYSQAPNAGHTNLALGTKMADPATGFNGSYALGGDGHGNVLTGSGIYTYSQDSRYDLVYGSDRSTSISVMPDSCFSTDTDCTGKIFTFPLGGAVGALGPLSGIGDGRMVGLVRGEANSQVYVISPADPLDLSKGLLATRIKEVIGDAYMYSDFTGGTLYSTDIDLTIPLDQMTAYKADSPLRGLAISWTAQGGSTATWKGLKFEARCYKESSSARPNFTLVPNIRDAGLVTVLNSVPYCAGQIVDRLEIRVRTEANSSDFTRTRQLKVFLLY